jgi:predicted enzyme related to lactoylglutathione lyase
MKLNNVRLLVDDFDRCFTFYKDVLDLECTWGKKGENYASFRVGEHVEIALFAKKDMNDALGISYSAMNKQAIDIKFGLIMEVDDVHQSYLDLKAKGIKFLTDAPKEMTEWGMIVAHFYDPKQNLIEIFEYIPNV